MNSDDLMDLICEAKRGLFLSIILLDVDKTDDVFKKKKKLMRTKVQHFFYFFLFNSSWQPSSLKVISSLQRRTLQKDSPPST